MKKEPWAISWKCNPSATTSFKMWYTLPKLLIFFSVFTTFSLASVSPPHAPSKPISYSDHCGSFVPESTPRKYSEFLILQHHTGYYTGGGSGILSQNSSYQPYYEPQNSIEFNPWRVQATYVQGLYKIAGNLRFQRDSMYYYVGNVTSRLPQYPGSIYNRPRSIPRQRTSISFRLDGFWSASSGKLCMVGTSSIYTKQDNWLNVPAVLKLYNLMNSTNVTSLISGSLEGLVSSENDLRYFEPVSILMLPRMNYEYTLVSNKSENKCTSGSNIPSSSLQIGLFCAVLKRALLHEFDLKYSSHCVSAKNCTPLSVSDLPRVVSLKIIGCSEDQLRLRVLVIFADSKNVWYQKPFNPNTTLVGEGSWNAKRNQLCVVACQFLNATDSLHNSTHVGDCSTRLSLRFPATWTIENTRRTVGKIWSDKNVTESGYFESIAFESPQNDIQRVLSPGLKYEYTKMEKVTKLCLRNKAANGKTNIYPNPFSYDMIFDMFLKSYTGETAWGSAVPLSVGNRFYRNSRYSNEIPAQSRASIGHFRAPVSYSYNNSIPLNISYQISINFKQLGNGVSELKKSSVSNELKISAEGIYDDTEGSLCMVGCRNLASSSRQLENDSVDCEILVNFQFPPTNSKNGSFIKGSIKSTRKKSDPLHFESWDLSSASGYLVEAKRSIWRMDVEITLVLISTTFACVFVALQIFHVKKYPDVLPSISIFMLLILTLSYMIPLMLNFEAMFTNSASRPNVFLGSGGWIEVNEVIVRVITMVAFLLQIRLLQLTWSARSANGTQKDFWIMEKKALFVALLVYVAGALAALIVHRENWKNSYNDGALLAYSEHSLLGTAFKSYAGLVLDGFLLPQILLNMLSKSKEKALSALFYVGTTFIRVLPHAYDLFRASNSAHHQLKESYIYASPVADFYSTAWDVIVPIGGLLFAGIIYLQQRFGGLCILPRKLRELGAYEKVATLTEG